MDQLLARAEEVPALFLANVIMHLPDCRMDSGHGWWLVDDLQRRRIKTNSCQSWPCTVVPEKVDQLKSLESLRTRESSQGAALSIAVNGSIVLPFVFQVVAVESVIFCGQPHLNLVAAANSRCAGMGLKEKSVLIADQIVDDAHDSRNVCGIVSRKYRSPSCASEFLEHFRPTSFGGTDCIVIPFEPHFPVFSDRPSLEYIRFAGIDGEHRNVSLFEVLPDFSLRVYAVGIPSIGDENRRAMSILCLFFYIANGKVERVKKGRQSIGLCQIAGNKMLH